MTSDLDLDAIADRADVVCTDGTRPGIIWLERAERDALAAEVRSLRAVRDAAEDALSAWAVYGRDNERARAVGTAMRRLSKALDGDQ